MKLAKRLQNSGEYIFSALAKRVAEVEKKSGRKVLNLGIGSPTFPPSKKYLNKFKEYIDQQESHLYPGYGPIPELRDALRKWYKKKFGVNLEKEEVYPLLGAKDGIAHLPLALVDEDDEVLIPDPGYPAFSGPLHLYGAKPVYYNLTEENNFKIKIEELEDKISTKTKLLWLNFPSNPTGQVITYDKLTIIVKLCRLKNILIIYDNVYSEIKFDGYVVPSILQVEGAKDLAVEIGSFSKSFSLAGYRMAWIAGNKEIIAGLAKIKSQIDTGMSIPLQKLGAYVLNNFDKRWYEDMIDTYKRRRDVLAQYLKKLDLKISLPKASLYIWAKIPENYKNSEEFCFELLEKKQILLTPGSAFGKNGERYVRASISSDISKIGSYL